MTSVSLSPGRLLRRTLHCILLLLPILEYLSCSVIWPPLKDTGSEVQHADVVDNILRAPEHVGHHRPRKPRRVRRWSRGGYHISSYNGFNIAITPTGELYGARSPDDRNALLRIWPIDRGIIVIQGAHSRRFIAIDENGRAFTTTRVTQTNHFLERTLPNHYVVFIPYLQRDDNVRLTMTSRGSLTTNEFSSARRGSWFLKYTANR